MRLDYYGGAPGATLAGLDLRIENRKRSLVTYVQLFILLFSFSDLAVVLEFLFFNLTLI